MLAAMNNSVEERGRANFLVEDLRLALAPKCVPTNHGPSKRATIVSLPVFFWTTSFQVLHGTKFRANIRSTDCLGPIVGPILSHIDRPKSNVHWTINYDAKPWFAHYCTKSKCPRRFWERDPEFLQTVNFAQALSVSLPSLLRSFFFFYVGNVGSFRTPMSQKIQTPKYLAETHSRKGPAGSIEHVQKIGVYISKTAWILDYERIDTLEPACNQYKLSGWHNE